jgi:hypothetical protein
VHEKEAGVIQSPPQRPSNVAAIVILGFVAAGIAEFAIDLIMYFAVRLHSLGEADAVSIAIAVLTGVIAGGVMFLARPRGYGVAAVPAVSAVVAGIIADLAAMVVFLTDHHLSIDADLFTGYFTHARPSFWIGNVLTIALAAGLTALRTRSVLATERRGAGAPPSQYGPYAPPYGPPPQPWGPQPQPPYGPPGPPAP